ncbi:MFS transporter [Halobacteriales archaeon QH_3_68_24]|nr:MAG: MFS transporter [Halobacteriales archaeon QH_3_68_24]
MSGYGRLGRAVAGLRGEGRGWLLLSVAVGWFLVLGMRFVVPGILPTITDDFTVSASEAGLAVTVLWVTYAAMQFPAGYFADRLGERVLLVAGLLVSAVGLVSYTFTPTFGLFVLATGVFGLGSGLYGPPRGTVISKTYDENDGAAFGLMLAAGSVGAAVLPAAAAVAVTSVGWRTAVGVVAPAFFLSAAAVWWAVPDTRVRTADGAGAVDGGDADAPDGDVTGAPDGGTGVADRSMLSAGRAAAVAVRDRRIALAVAGATLMLFAFQAATAFLTTYLTATGRFTQGTAGAVLGVLFLVGAASQFAGGGLADRFGTPRVLVGIGAASVVPLAALPLVEGRLALGVVGALVGVRMAVGPVSNAYIIALLPDDIQGTAWGALRTGFFIVGSFGSTAVGYMADAGYFDLAFYMLAGITAVGAGVYVFLPERP